MTETILIAIIIAKVKGYKLKPMLKCWPLYPIVIFELLYIILQIDMFAGTYNFVGIAPVYKTIYMYLFLIPIFIYGLYMQGLIGSIFIFIGTLLNKIVIYANGGKMPVYPKISYYTGYIKTDILSTISDLHVIGNSETKLKFLSDIIDVGYSVLSIGDVFIRIFVGIIIFQTIKFFNINYDKNIS